MDEVGGEAVSLEDARGWVGGGVEAEEEGVETGTSPADEAKNEGGTADKAPKETGV